jgi:hypothetical protein
MSTSMDRADCLEEGKCRPRIHDVTREVIRMRGSSFVCELVVNVTFFVLDPLGFG